MCYYSDEIIKIGNFDFKLIQDKKSGGVVGGRTCKKAPYQFFPITSTNKGNCPQNFLTFSSFNPFVTLV